MHWRKALILWLNFCHLIYQCLWVTYSHTNCVSVNPYSPNPQFLKELLEDLLVLLPLYNSHSYFSALCGDLSFLPFPCHRLQWPTTAVFANCAANRPRSTEREQWDSPSARILGLILLPSYRWLYFAEILFFCATISHIWRVFLSYQGEKFGHVNLIPLETSLNLQYLLICIYVTTLTCKYETIHTEIFGRQIISIHAGSSGVEVLQCNQETDQADYTADFYMPGEAFLCWPRWLPICCFLPTRINEPRCE